MHENENEANTSEANNTLTFGPETPRWPRKFNIPGCNVGLYYNLLCRKSSTPITYR